AEAEHEAHHKSLLALKEYQDGEQSTNGHGH
ncbi:ubiquinol-cytochrome c reductase cytochrome b subunit, partial [Mycobacteroides abscessus M93]